MKKKTRYFSVLLVLLLLSAGLLSSCRKSEIMALYFAVAPGEAELFDPQIVGAGANEVVVRNSFEGLVYVDEKGNIEPGVAERWTVSADGLTYTFYLREDARWHLTKTARGELTEKLGENFDESVQARDFVFALQRAVDPNTGCAGATLLKNIENAGEILAGNKEPSALGVKALSPTKLEIRLESPQRDFTEILSEPLCMPCNQAFFEATGGRYGLFIRYIISNGPFYMTRFDNGAYRMERNPDYVGAHPAKADVIWLYAAEDPAAVASEMNDKTYSGAVADRSLYAGLKTKNTTLISTPDTLRAFLLNCAGDVMSSIYFRKAFCTAVDPAVMTESEDQEGAAGFMPGLFSDVQNRYSPVFDPNTAENLLKTGLDSIHKESVSVPILCEEQYERSVRKLIQEYQKALGIGFNLSVQTLTGRELERRVKNGDYEIAFYPVRAALFGESRYFEQFSALSGESLTRLEDEDFDLAVAALERGKGVTKASMSAAEQALSASAALLPVWQEDSLFVMNEGVSGVRVLPGADRIYFFDAVKER